MSVLSLTFHNTDSVNAQWDEYVISQLYPMIENLLDAEKYLLSLVESDLINEGKNTNLLLIFQDEEKRQDFVEIELVNITERIQQQFADQVMIFKTYLNPQKSRL